MGWCEEPVFLPLAAIMDVFTRCVRGWELSRSLDQGLTLGALRRALRRGRPEVHHSDQGVQYAATGYIDRLTQVNSSISMAAVGEPRENGYAERLMRTIKEEEVALTEYRDYAGDQVAPDGLLPFPQFARNQLESLSSVRHPEQAVGSGGQGGIAGASSNSL